MDAVDEESEIDIEIEVDETTMHMSGGKLSLDDFEILGVLGKGAYGKVFQVRKITSGVIYAMKVLKKQDVIKHKVVTHANSEKTVLTEMNHPFIVGLAFAFQTPEKLYLVMEYVGGGELFSRLDEVEEMEEYEARFYACEVLLALEHLHSKDFVYRDLKPENILIRMNGHICLADFGFAKKTRSEDKIGTKTFCGTIHYMAPEIINKTGHGKSVDWWSLGVLIFEMLTGETPFHDANRKVIQQKVLTDSPVFPSHMSDLAKDLCMRLLNKTTTERLGYRGPEEVKSHPWFKGADWNAYLARKVKPPFVPAAINVLDISNFDSKFTQETPVDSPPNPAMEVPPSALFKGFSYTAPSPLLLELPGRGRAFTPMASPNLGPSALSGLASPAARALASPAYRSMVSPNARGIAMPSPSCQPRTPNRIARDIVGSPTTFLLPSGMKQNNCGSNSGTTWAGGGYGGCYGSSSGLQSYPEDHRFKGGVGTEHSGLIQNLHADKKATSPESTLKTLQRRIPPNTNSSSTASAAITTPSKAPASTTTTTDTVTSPTSPADSSGTLSPSTPTYSPTIVPSNFTADLKEDYFELRLDKQKKKRRPKKPQKLEATLSNQLSRLHLQQPTKTHPVVNPPLLSTPPLSHSNYTLHANPIQNGTISHPGGHVGYSSQTPSSSSCVGSTSNHAFYAHPQQYLANQHPNSNFSSTYASGSAQNSGNQFIYSSFQTTNLTSQPLPSTAYLNNYSAMHHSNGAHAGNGQPLLYPHQPVFFVNGAHNNQPAHFYPQASSHQLYHHQVQHPHQPLPTHQPLPHPTHQSHHVHQSHPNQPLLQPTHQAAQSTQHPQLHQSSQHAVSNAGQEPTRQYGFRVLSASDTSHSQPGVGPSKTLSHVLRPQMGIKQCPLLSQVDQDVHVWTEFLNPPSSAPPATPRSSILSTLTSFPKHS